MAPTDIPWEITYRGDLTFLDCFNDDTVLDNDVTVSELEYVSGDLIIRDIGCLESARFASLHEIGGNLVIENVGPLETIQFLSLEKVRGDIIIKDLPNLKMFRFPLLTSVGLNFNIVDIDGEHFKIDEHCLPELREVGIDFAVVHNSELEEFHLPALETVGDDFLVANNEHLHTVLLDTLSTVGHKFEINGSNLQAEFVHAPELAEQQHVGDIVPFCLNGAPTCLYTEDGEEVACDNSFTC